MFGNLLRILKTLRRHILQILLGYRNLPFLEEGQRTTPSLSLLAGQRRCICAVEFLEKGLHVILEILVLSVDGGMTHEVTRCSHLTVFRRLVLETCTDGVKVWRDTGQVIEAVGMSAVFKGIDNNYKQHHCRLTA